MVEYTTPAAVREVRSDDTAPPNPYADGYGPKVPTRHWVRYGNRWHRVYVMQYGNAGSAYIKHRGGDLFLDLDTRQRLEGE